jgi:hypothetical protein
MGEARRRAAREAAGVAVDPHAARDFRDAWRVLWRNDRNARAVGLTQQQQQETRDEDLTRVVDAMARLRDRLPRLLSFRTPPLKLR